MILFSYYILLRAICHHYAVRVQTIFPTIRLYILNYPVYVSKKVLLIGICAVLCSSCSMFNQIGENAGDGFGKGLSPHLETMGESAIDGLKTGIDNAQFDMLIDSLVHRLSDSLGVGASLVREELFGDSTAQNVAGIRDSLFGEQAQVQLRLMVSGVMEELLGERTRREVGVMRDELFGEALRLNLIGIRDELTGPETEERLAALARAFVYEISSSYADTLRPLIREDIEYTAEETKGVFSWLRKNIQGIIYVFGAVVAALIGVIWYFRRKNKQSSLKRDKNEQIVKIITKEIEGLREVNPQLYDRMTTQIQRQTTDEKVEMELREILGKQGLL